MSYENTTIVSGRIRPAHVSYSNSNVSLKPKRRISPTFTYCVLDIASVSQYEAESSGQDVHDVAPRYTKSFVSDPARKEENQARCIYDGRMIDLTIYVQLSSIAFHGGGGA